MTASSQPAPRVFVSHSHADNAFCRQLVAELRSAGADVWYDEHNLGWGELRRDIDRELPTRPYFVVILSPEAVASDWVNREIDAALDMLRTGEVRIFLPVIARTCSIPPTLRGFRRLDYTAGMESGHTALFHALGLRQLATSYTEPSATASPSVPDSSLSTLPVMPPDRFPPHFAELGFLPRKARGIEYILPPVCDVPASEFLMGSDPKRDSEASSDEHPQHRVTLPAYQIARFPVTVAEYACFVRAGHAEPSRGAHGVDWPTQLTRLDHPVTCLTWRDAVAFAAWLSDRSGQPWRLPSEAEWEKAARGTDGRLYPWGDTFDTGRCNTIESGIKTTTPVDRYPGGASPCGARDLAGNVWEWTASVLAPYPYTPNSSREEPVSFLDRVLRGSSWYGDPWFARAACRYNLVPEFFDDFFGFRLLLAVPNS